MCARAWGLASWAPTRRMQSAWEMQMRDQGVTAASASSRMNLRKARKARRRPTALCTLRLQSCIIGDLLHLDGLCILNWCTYACSSSTASQ